MDRLRQSPNRTGTRSDGPFRVVHHQRRPQPGQVSIERLFESIRGAMSPRWTPTVAVSPEFSGGLAPRLRNLAAARRQAGDVHHVVGDIQYLAYALPPERLVVTIHDSVTLNRLSGVARAVFRQFWYSGPARRAAVLTTISEFARTELFGWIGPTAERAVVIPNCVRDEFQPHARPFFDAAPVVLQVGTSPNKNVERVAAALVGTPCRLDVVGVLSEAQRQAIDRLGVPVRERGLVSDTDLVDAYREADLVVFASLYEGFGLPILEAQATGRPVVTSDRCSMPEAAGAGALLVNPESVEAIRHAIEQIVESQSLRERLVGAGFENVRRYRPESVARQYEAVYDRVLSRTRSAPAL